MSPKLSFDDTLGYCFRLLYRGTPQNGFQPVPEASSEAKPHSTDSRDACNVAHFQLSSVNLDAIALFLKALVDKVQGKPITVILDNASIHKSKEIQPLVELLKRRGLTLYFLPPYSPELNRIERLWHKVKHTWLVPKCRDKQTLEADVEEIMDNLGFKYQFAFY